MKSQEFVQRLGTAQELMLKEDYPSALEILAELKEIEKQGDFDYNLTHKLYQLDSNCKSLLNQQIILEHIFNASKDTKIISIDDLGKIIKKKAKLNLESAIIKREIEILILRGLLTAKIEDNNLII